jgi:dipeptidyl-peptidase-4
VQRFEKSEDVGGQGTGDLQGFAAHRMNQLKTPGMQRLPRDQKRLDILAVDPATGASRIIHSETSATWINLHDIFRPLKDGSILWASERDGYRHLYRLAGGTSQQLTSGRWVVDDLVGVDEKRGRLWFTGFAPAERPEVVVVVMLEDGGGAGQSGTGNILAAPIARKVMQAVLSR